MALRKMFRLGYLIAMMIVCTLIIESDFFSFSDGSPSKKCQERNRWIICFNPYARNMSIRITLEIKGTMFTRLTNATNKMTEKESADAYRVVNEVRFVSALHGVNCKKRSFFWIHHVEIKQIRQSSFFCKGNWK